MSSPCVTSPVVSTSDWTTNAMSVPGSGQLGSGARERASTTSSRVSTLFTTAHFAGSSVLVELPTVVRESTVQSDATTSLLNPPYPDWYMMLARTNFSTCEAGGTLA